MIEKFAQLVRLGQEPWGAFLYNVIMDARPLEVIPPPHSFLPTDIVYELPIADVRRLAHKTDVKLPTGTGLCKLRITFRGGNGYEMRLNASAELIWYFMCARSPAEFENELGGMLEPLAIRLATTSPAMAVPTDPPIDSLLDMNLDQFRIEHHWLFEKLMPCDLAQETFHENFWQGRNGKSAFLTNLYLEALWHLKRCETDSCLHFSSDNDALERSMALIKNFE